MLHLAPTAIHTLRLLVATFDRAGIPYQVTGGLAGNFHGSSWPLHDIDLEVDSPLSRLADLFLPHLTFGPARYEDEEFSLDLLSLEINGISIDINSIHNVQVFTPTGPVPIHTDLSLAIPFPLDNFTVRVQPLDALIHYKQLLNREADVLDLRSLLTPP